jgi:hypothetical protein
MEVRGVQKMDEPLVIGVVGVVAILGLAVTVSAVVMAKFNNVNLRIRFHGVGITLTCHR